MTIIFQRQSIVCLALLTVLCLLTQAQSGLVEAHVTSVRGDVQLLSSARPGAFVIRRNDSVSPGDEIVTGSNGRAVISLSDGSVITVLPNSRVKLKDFRSAHSMRELLEITIGRVRVKIHKLGGKPNPYLLNSPAASIAVRGTEFIVDVQSSGETLVAVSEGLVEVASLANQNNKRLVAPGGSVIVRSNGDIGLSIPGPGGELGGRSKIASSNLDPASSLGAVYQRSVDSLAQNSIVVFPSLFAAFPDAHLDSLDNPAYATEFNRAQGRLLLLPSISATDRLVVSKGMAQVAPGFPEKGRPHRFDYTFTPQFSLFIPTSDSRFTFGVSVSAARTSLHALTLYQSSEEAPANLTVNRVDSDGGAATLTAINNALIVAYRFGADRRTSLGVAIEHLSGDGSFLNVRRVAEAVNAGGSGIESKTELAKTRLTIGLAREFAGARKLGIYFRRGVTTIDQQNRLRVLNHSQLLPFDDTAVSTDASEVGARWRSPLTRRLFYGLEASYLYEHIDSRREFVSGANAVDRDRAQRARFGGGLGYVLRPSALFSLDIAGGFYNTSRPQTPGITATNKLQNERSKFFSIHSAAQTDLWKRAFASASFLAIHRSSIYEPLNSTPTRQRSTDFFSTIGVGWKFKPNLITQYLITTDHSRRAPSHSLLFRYTFDLNITGEK